MNTDTVQNNSAYRVCESASTQETQRLGELFGACLSEGDVVILTGDLGAGKTQFTKGVARALGVKQEVTSPTFVLQSVYQGKELCLFHFDLYRLNSADQLEDTGIFDVCGIEGASLIEWGEQFASELAQERLDIVIERVGSESDAGDDQVRAGGVQASAPASDSADAANTAANHHPFVGDDPAASSFEPKRRLSFIPHGARAKALVDAFFEVLEQSSKGPGYILGIDTSSDQLCCTICTKEGKKLVSLDHHCRRLANVELVSSIKNCLAQASLSFDDLDSFVVGRGPGSFTGVRIGIATAKGLASALEKPLYGASTLDAVAWNCWLSGERGLLGVVADALRQEVYPGLFNLDETGPHRLFSSETVIKAHEAPELWEAQKEKIVLSGDGLNRYAALFEEAGFSKFLPKELWIPSGEGLVRACLSELAKQPGTSSAQPQQENRATLAHLSGDPALVLPLYTRLSDAEENERKRLGQAVPASARVSGCADLLANRHLQLRPLSLNDLDQVTHLEQAAFATSAHKAWTYQQFYEELSQPKRCWWVAHDEESILGFCGGNLAGDQFEICDLVVKSEAQRSGIASKLLDRVAYDAQVLGANQLVLEVAENNTAAQELYKKYGFIQSGYRKDYYANGIGAKLLEADLPLAMHHELNDPAPEASLLSRRVKHSPHTAREQEILAEHSPLIFAIESSCDETAMAIIDGSGQMLSSVVATQIDFHARFGGVVPEIASRKHTEALVGVFQETLAQAAEKLGIEYLCARDLYAVGVTYGPGLVGALVVGLAFAKGLCAACDLKLIGVNHLEGHLFANLLEDPELAPPFIATLVSGGHTMLVHVHDWGDYVVLGETIDDAVGEAFDKVAKALGLGYPGGPIISRLAAKGNPKAISFPRAMLHSHDYRFSLSGLKTSVITYIEKENRAGRPVSVPDLAASFQAAVVDVQLAKALAAAEQTGAKAVCLGGGVAANKTLREAYQESFGKKGIRVIVPPMAACTDNAQMIALVARWLNQRGVEHPLTLDADPNLQFGVSAG